MIDRRQLLAFGGLLGAMPPVEPDANGEGTAVAQQIPERYVSDIANALGKIANTLEADHSTDPIAPIWNRQIDYLKSTNKFPDFIDVSPDIWTRVYFWHVRMQQPLVLARDAQGRYTLALGFTNLVLRPDVAPNFISTPYDAR